MSFSAAAEALTFTTEKKTAPFSFYSHNHHLFFLLLPTLQAISSIAAKVYHMAYEMEKKKSRERARVLTATETAREHKRPARNLRVAAGNMGRSIVVAIKAPRA